MRTTLELDDDLVKNAKELARAQGVTLGQVISQLARQSLVARAAQKVRNGVPLFAPKAEAARSAMRIVNELLDDE
jgi:hypothetical protein